MTIVTRCRHCEQVFEADHRAIVAGAWRLCPLCRETAPPVPPNPRRLPSPTPEMPVARAERSVMRRCLRCHGAVAAPAVLCAGCRPAGPGGMAA